MSRRASLREFAQRSALPSSASRDLPSESANFVSMRNSTERVRKVLGNAATRNYSTRILQTKDKSGRAPVAKRVYTVYDDDGLMTDAAVVASAVFDGEEEIGGGSADAAKLRGGRAPRRRPG